MEDLFERLGGWSLICLHFSVVDFGGLFPRFFPLESLTFSLFFSFVILRLWGMQSDAMRQIETEGEKVDN